MFKCVMQTNHEVFRGCEPLVSRRREDVLPNNVQSWMANSGNLPSNYRELWASIKPILCHSVISIPI